VAGVRKVSHRQARREIDERHVRPDSGGEIAASKRNVKWPGGMAHRDDQFRLVLLGLLGRLDLRGHRGQRDGDDGYHKKATHAGVHTTVHVSSNRLAVRVSRIGSADPIAQWTSIPAMSDITELVVVRSFSTPHEAHLACSVLHGAGLEANVADEHIVTADWFLSNAVGGVKVMVREDDLETARELLDNAAVVSDDADPSQISDTENRDEDECPRCGGRTWVPVTHGKQLAVAVMYFLPLILPVWRRRQCRHCGYEAR